MSDANHHESLFRNNAPSMFGPLCATSFSSPSTQRSICKERFEAVYQKSPKYSDEPSWRTSHKLQFSSERFRSMLSSVDRILSG